MPLEYCAYGLRLQADAPIPALLPFSRTDCPPADSIDVRVWLNRMPSWWTPESQAAAAEYYRSPYISREGRPSLTVWKLQEDGWYRLLYHDDNEFLVNPRSGEIWCRWPPSAPAEDFVPYLVGPVLGFVLRFREVCCLHASAVNIGGRIIALAGPHQAGKSTTAAAFVKLGYPVLTDDIVALAEADHEFLVQPGYPRLCLWPDVETPLYSSQSLPQITAGWDKRYMDLTSGSHCFQLQSQPLSAVYLLEDRMDAADCPKVEAVPISSALVKLSANTYMTYLLDPDLKAKEFYFLSRLVSRVPVRRVVPHTDPAGIPRLCEAILEDLKALAE